MLKVGLSGKIASGKSEVEKILSQLGFMVFDLDILSREVFDNNKNEIFNIFKTLNRSEIAKIIFQNNSQKEKLEKIIHPKLKEKILEIFEKYNNEKIIIISGALLFESGFYKLFDKTIYVEANEDIRLERLIKRNNLSYNDAKKRINAQDDNQCADYIIKNNSDINTLKKQIKEIISSLQLRWQ